MTIYNVETKDDFFIVKANSKQDIINHFYKPRTKINRITEFPEHIYDMLIESGLAEEDKTIII